MFIIYIFIVYLFLGVLENGFEYGLIEMDF